MIILNDNNDSSSNWVPKVLIIVSVLILIGAVGFFIYLKVKKKSPLSPVSPVPVKPQAPVVVPVQSVKTQVSVDVPVSVKKQSAKKEVGYNAVAK